MRIPFKTLSFNKEGDWGINFVREIVRQNETVAWSSRNRSYNPSSDDTNTEPSLDIYCKITSGLNASLTFNTDFSASEVDNRQVNLNDNVSESIGINSRLHWSPQAGRNIYFVVNHNLVERPADRSYHSTSTDLTLKVDYTFRF